MRVTAAVWITPGEAVEVYAPSVETSPVTGVEISVPWIVSFGQQVHLHFDTRESLTELRDALMAALDASDAS